MRLLWLLGLAGLAAGLFFPEEAPPPLNSSAVMRRWRAQRAAYHPDFRGLSRAAAEALGLKGRWTAEARKRSLIPNFLLEKPGALFYKSAGWFMPSCAALSGVSFGVAMIVHWQNKAEMKSFFYSFMLWDLGLQFVLYFTWDSYTSTRSVFWSSWGCKRRYVRNRTVDTSLDHIQVTCPSWRALAPYYAQTRFVLPVYCAQWTDVATTLDRCLAITWPAWYLKRLGQPDAPLRRRIVPLFLLLFFALHQVLGYANTKTWSWEEGGGQDVLLDRLLNNRLFWQEDGSVILHRWKHLEWIEKGLPGIAKEHWLWVVLTLQFVPMRRALGAGVIWLLSRGTLPVSVVLWSWLLLKLWRRRTSIRQGNAQPALEAKNASAIRMSLILGAVEWMRRGFGFYVSLHQRRPYTMGHVLFAEEPKVVLAALEWWTWNQDLKVVTDLVIGGNSLNWLLLVLLSSGYRKLLVKTLGRLRARLPKSNASVSATSTGMYPSATPAKTS